jgi:hypothetical protein
MEIMPNTVTEIALDEDFHNQAEKLSDYCRNKVTYSLLKIYEYLPFQIPFPFKNKARDFTINHRSIFRIIDF